MVNEIFYWNAFFIRLYGMLTEHFKMTTPEIKIQISIKCHFNSTGKKWVVLTGRVDVDLNCAIGADETQVTMLKEVTKLVTIGKIHREVGQRHCYLRRSTVRPSVQYSQRVREIILPTAGCRTRRKYRFHPHFDSSILNVRKMDRLID